MIGSKMFLAYIALSTLYVIIPCHGDEETTGSEKKLQEPQWTASRLLSSAYYPDGDQYSVRFPAGSSRQPRPRCCDIEKNLFTDNPKEHTGGFNQLGAAFGLFVSLGLVDIPRGVVLPRISDDGCAAKWEYVRALRDEENENLCPNTLPPVISLTQIYRLVGESYFGIDSDNPGKFKLARGMLEVKCNYKKADGSFQRNAACVADMRLNMYAPLLLIATLFIREHNRLYDGLLLKKLDELPTTLFKEAKAINEMQYNQIVKEWMIDMVGNEKTKEKNGNSESGTEPTLYQEFAVGVVPTLWSLVSQDFLNWTDDDRRNMAPVTILLDNAASIQTLGLEALLRGHLHLPCKRYDLQFATAIKENAGVSFHTPAKMCYGARDHGLPDMATLRQMATQKESKSYNEVNSDVSTINMLKTLYPHLRMEDTVIGLDVDAPFGLLAEERMSDAAVGPTAATLIETQITLLLSGDKAGIMLICEKITEENKSKCDSLMGTTMAHVILRNTGHECTNRKAFMTPSRSRAAGEDLCRVDLVEMYDTLGDFYPLSACFAPGCQDYPANQISTIYDLAKESNSSVSTTMIMVYILIPLVVLALVGIWYFGRRTSHVTVGGGLAGHLSV